MRTILIPTDNGVRALVLFPSLSVMHHNRTIQVYNQSFYYESLDIAKFQSKLNYWEDHVVGIYLAVICLLAVALNTLVIYTCIRNWHSLVMSDYYILNLACSDVILPLSGFPLAISSSFSHQWIFGDIGCTAYGFLGFFFGLSSITTLMVMGITRYISICHPQIDISNWTTTTRLIVFVYVYALIWSLIPLFGWGSYSVEAYGTSCTLQWTENRSYITLVALFCILMPSVIMMLTYGFILLKCHKSGKSVTAWRRDKSYKIPRKEAYLVKITFAMCWGFLMSWMPYGVVSMWTAYGNSDILPHRVVLAAVLFAKSSTVVNPVIYFLMSKKFRPLILDSINSGLCRCKLTCYKRIRLDSDATTKTRSSNLKSDDNSGSSGRICDYVYYKEKVVGAKIEVFV